MKELNNMKTRREMIIEMIAKRENENKICEQLIMEYELLDKDPIGFKDMVANNLREIEILNKKLESEGLT